MFYHVTMFSFIITDLFIDVELSLFLCVSERMLMSTLTMFVIGGE